MARNRSSDPIKIVSDTVPLTAYNTLVQSFQLKLKTLEKKYLGFVVHCTKIIKDAQSFLDVSINEHLSGSVNQSEKIIETLTKQKMKLNKDLKSIEKMSVDLRNGEEGNKNLKFLGYFKEAKEKVLEKLEDHKSKYFIQTVLMNLEDKVLKDLEIMENFGEYYARLYEVEEMLGKKTQEFKLLQESYDKLKEEGGQMHTTERRIGSPGLRSFAGRTSPTSFANKDQEVAKLKSDIKFLQEKIMNLTGTAKKIVAKKDFELQKLISEKSKVSHLQAELKNCFEYFDVFEEKIQNKLGMLNSSVHYLGDKVTKLRFWKKMRGLRADDRDSQKIVAGLEEMVDSLNEEIRKKDEVLLQQKEKFGKLNRLYSDLHEKSKIFSVKYESLMSEYNEKNEKNKELTNKSIDLLAENEKLRNYKNELDREITELKDYFQSDIDSLSDKIEKLFGENLCLKQKNEEIREKYERVMGEKEKLLVQIYEIKGGETVSRSETVKNANNSSLALKQELKIASIKIENLIRENVSVKNDKKQVIEKVFQSIFAIFSNFSSNLANTYSKKIENLSEKLKKIQKVIKNSPKIQPSTSNSMILKNKIADLSKSSTKLMYDYEKLQKKCEHYESLIFHLQQTCEKLTSQQDSLYKCPTCDSFSRIIKEKDDRILYLQKEVHTLSEENLKLNKEIQEIEFTFQNHMQDSKEFEIQHDQKFSKKLITSSEFYKTPELRSLSPTLSDVDLTYTLEGTTIRSTHDPNTPISVSNDEIKDLEFIE